MKKYIANIANLTGYATLKVKATSLSCDIYLKVRSKYSKCPCCDLKTKKVYETKLRSIRHTFTFDRPSWLKVTQRRFKCNACKHRFWEILPGLAKYSRRSESLRKQIATAALNGHDNKLTARWFKVGQATVQRDIEHHTKLEISEKSSSNCPKILGIDEHFFTRKKGFATTIADLERKKVFDVVLGRSEKSLEAYLRRLKNKNKTRLIVMDLSATYRSIAKKYFPNALIVADRFHVIRLVNQKALETWKQLDPKGKANRGLLSLFRRSPGKLNAFQAQNLRRYLRSKPGLEQLYDLRNKMYKLLMQKGLRDWQMKTAIAEYMEIIEILKASGFRSLTSLAETLESWQEEILRMLRFNRSNGLVEGFHNKMEKISRVAYGFRNFENYRKRVLLQCA